MNSMHPYIQDHQLDLMRLVGRRAGADCAADRRIAVFNPYTDEQIGSVPKATVQDVRETLQTAQRFKPNLSRFERATILNRAAALIDQRRNEVAQLITAESGLCIKDALYEAGRVSDVLLFGAMECLKDDEKAPRLYPARPAAGGHHRHHAVQPPDEPGGAQGGAQHCDQ